MLIQEQKKKEVIMDVRIQSIHFDATAQLEAFIQKKVSKLEQYFDGIILASVTTSPSSGALPLRSVDLIAYNSKVCPFGSYSNGETPHFKRRSFGSSAAISFIARYELTVAVSL